MDAGATAPGRPAAGIEPGLGGGPTEIAQLQQKRPVGIDLGRRIEPGEHRTAVDQVQAMARETAAAA